MKMYTFLNMTNNRVLLINKLLEIKCKMIGQLKFLITIDPQVA